MGNYNNFVKLLLHWYRLNKRRLPWRDVSDPYAVWVSEIMLQQTRVETVIPYFIRWMEKFPDLPGLALADEQDVLRVWEGLGYYSRARNLHKAARLMMDTLGGSLPSDTGELVKLPGIGAYTAGAIASIAFGKDQPAIDGNFRRVFARVFAVQEPIDSPAGDRIIKSLAVDCLPGGQAGDFNQAVMDLGATVCIPGVPKCLECPISNECKSFLQGVQEKIPVKNPGRNVPSYSSIAFVILRSSEVLLYQRPAGQLLAGMWAYPELRIKDVESGAVDLLGYVESELKLTTVLNQDLGTYNHAYTHFKINVKAVLLEYIADLGISIGEWVPLQELDQIPMGKIDRMITRDLATFQAKNEGAGTMGNDK